MKNPMPIEDLPEYLRSTKGRITDDAPVVDMGRIVSPRNWFKTISLSVAACLLVALSGLMGYNVLSTKNVTVFVDANNSSPTSISKIISDGGGQVVSVKQYGESTYEVKISTRKNLSSFIDWLRKNKDISNVELEN
jgi:hypothetical protein